MRRAMVTGAASGLGREVVLGLTRRGCHVALVDIDAVGARAVAEEAGAGAVVVLQDLTAPGGPRGAVEQAVAALGGLDIAVNNAGYGAGEAFLELDEANWDRTLDLNLKATAFICSASGRHMKAAGVGERGGGGGDLAGAGRARVHHRRAVECQRRVG